MASIPTNRRAMKSELTAPETEDPTPDPLAKIHPCLLLLDYDPTSQTGRLRLPPNRFKHEILNHQGAPIGEFTGAVCDDLDEVEEAIRIPMNHLQRIDGGIRFPCAALINIYVDEEYERKGFGSGALAEFDAISRLGNCHIGLVRVGYNGLIARDKNLRFYAKNGWHRLNLEENEIPWMVKYYESTF